MSGEQVSAEEQRKIIAEFQRLREQQREIVEQITKVEDEKSEFTRVIKLLTTECQPTQTCYRLVSTTLIEQKIQDCVPQLQFKLEQLTKLAETLNTRLIEKGKELNEHRTKHNIRVLTQKESEEIRQRMLEQQIANAKKSS